MSTREERRKAEREEERKRQEELEAELEKPRLPSFEAPATGKIKETPPVGRPPAKKP